MELDLPLTFTDRSVFPGEVGILRPNLPYHICGSRKQYLLPRPLLRDDASAQRSQVVWPPIRTFLRNSKYRYAPASLLSN